MARVPRSRLAFALAVTVAALPILVLDNLPASAEKADEVEQVTSASAHEDAAPTTTAPPARWRGPGVRGPEDISTTLRVPVTRLQTTRVSFHKAVAGPRSAQARGSRSS
jgi:hypothetical protein